MFPLGDSLNTMSYMVPWISSISGFSLTLGMVPSLIRRLRAACGRVFGGSGCAPQHLQSSCSGPVFILVYFDCVYCKWKIFRCPAPALFSCANESALLLPQKTGNHC